MYNNIYVFTCVALQEPWNRPVWNFLLETAMKICLSCTRFVMNNLSLALHEDLLHVCAHE